MMFNVTLHSVKCVYQNGAANHCCEVWCPAASSHTRPGARRAAAKKAEAMSDSRFCSLGVTFSVWFIWNLVLNMYNKWVLSRTGFHFPLALSMSNKFIGWLGSLITLRCSADEAPGKLPTIGMLVSQFKRPIVHLHGVLTALNIGAHEPRLTVPRATNVMLSGMGLAADSLPFES